MSDHTSGLEQRYIVHKTHDPDGRHIECRYFVLDPQHDRHALAALAFYCSDVEADDPQLAADLDAWIQEITGDPADVDR